MGKEGADGEEEIEGEGGEGRRGKEGDGAEEAELREVVSVNVKKEISKRTPLLSFISRLISIYEDITLQRRIMDPWG